MFEEVDRVLAASSQRASQVEYDAEEEPIEVLLDAVTQRDVATCELLLSALSSEARAQLVNECGACGDTALTRAACEGATEVAKFLLQAKADVNLPDLSGYRPLTWAAMENEVNMVILLSNHGADVNVPDRRHSGCTPLTVAAGNGNTETCLVLLGYGANANYQTSQGTTALDVAKQYAFDDTCEILKATSARPYPFRSDPRPYARLRRTPRASGTSSNSLTSWSAKAAVPRPVARPGSLDKGP